MESNVKLSALIIFVLTNKLPHARLTGTVASMSSSSNRMFSDYVYIVPQYLYAYIDGEVCTARVAGRRTNPPVTHNKTVRAKVRGRSALNIYVIAGVCVLPPLSAWLLG